MYNIVKNLKCELIELNKEYINHSNYWLIYNKNGKRNVKPFETVDSLLNFIENSSSIIIIDITMSIIVKEKEQ